MKRPSIRHTIKSEINIIPFLDILLVLLIIFMITPSKLIQSFEVSLPDSKTTTNIINNNEKFIITIEILGMGLYNIIVNNKHIGQQVQLSQLSLDIQHRMRTTPNIMCLIAASKTIKYNEVIKVLNLLNSIGVHSIGMLTNSSN